MIFNGESIIYVENVEEISKQYISVFESLKLDVDHYSDNYDAWDEGKSYAVYAAFWIDIGTPQKDGTAFAKDLESVGVPQQLFIFHTGYTEVYSEVLADFPDSQVIDKNGGDRTPEGVIGEIYRVLKKAISYWNENRDA